MNYTLINKLAYIPTNEYMDKYRDVERFIGFCKTCHTFGKSWACPPFDYDSKDILDKYKHCYVIGTQVIFSEDFIASSKDKEINALSQSIMRDVRAKFDHRLLNIEKKYSSSKVLFAGNCHWCPNQVCTRTLNEPCRYPTLIRPSLEAYGFDISKTTSELLQLELKWGKNGFLPPYFILVSGILSNEEITDLDILLQNQDS